MSMAPMEARDRLARCQQEAVTPWRGVDAIIATTQALAALVDWSEMGKYLSREQWLIAMLAGLEAGTLERRPVYAGND